MKIIIDISEEEYKDLTQNGENTINLGVLLALRKAVRDSTPLDDVKAEIEKNAYPIVHGVNNHEKGMTLYGILQVLDRIGKESETN